jgi:transcriptional regulator with XRE-family HTH domain
MSRGTRKDAPPFQAVRDAQGRSQAAVAEKADLNWSYYAQIERGEKVPSVPVLYRLSVVLGLDDLERQLRPFVRDGDG